MTRIVVRLLLIALGLGFGQIGLDSFARGGEAAPLQLGLALLFLIAGTAGFVVPLLEGGVRKEVRRV